MQASLMSSLLIGSCSAPGDEKESDTVLVPTVELEIVEIKNELAVMRKLLERAISNQEDR